MKKFIKRLFARFRRNSVASLKNESEDILNIFTKTMTELSEVNAAIDEGVKKRQHRITKLEKEQIELRSISHSNTKVIKKLVSILED